MFVWYDDPQDLSPALLILIQTNAAVLIDTSDHVPGREPFSTAHASAQGIEDTTDLLYGTTEHHLEVHMDFQMVLRCSIKEIGRILNTLGARVRGGERFSAGDMVTGIYEDCSVRLDEYEECGRKVLRVIIPDKHNRFPEDPDCMVPYTLQRLKMDDLQKKDGGFICG